METKIPTHDEIRATFASVRDLVQCNHLCLDATIDDYPIGRRERGKSKRGADPLFQVLVARDESGSIVLTTNRPFPGDGAPFSTWTTPWQRP